MSSKRQLKPKKDEKLALRLSSGMKEGALFPLKKRSNIIGRRVGVSIPIQDSKVSREHAVISFKKGAFFVNDLKSTNGTFLNNSKLGASKKLSVGDEVRLGSSVFKVETLEPKKEKAAQWSSETRVIPLRVMQKEKASKVRSISGRRWISLVPGLKENFFKIQMIKWFGLAAGIACIVLAFYI